MNGELAELIALVAHGNAFLYGLCPPAELTRANSTFQYVESVRFIRHADAGAKEPMTIATTTSAWFEELKGSGAERIWLIIPAIADRNLAGFANAGPEAMLVTYQDNAEVWTGSWSVLSPRPDESRLWTVHYTSMPSARDVNGGFGSVEDAAAQLRAVLADADGLARRDPGLRAFAAWFKDAERLLDDPYPTPPYHADMLPEVGYSLESRQLLAASTRAWVFGGMGSWNDIFLEDDSLEREYERISGSLWQAVLGGLASSGNAFDPSAA